jgi:hypothetical protein
MLVQYIYLHLTLWGKQRVNCLTTIALVMLLQRVSIYCVVYFAIAIIGEVRLCMHRATGV